MKKIKKEYLIKASTVEDALENWVWIKDDSKNRFIKIYNPKSKKFIIVFKRTIDDNFIDFYNSKKTNKIIDILTPTIVMNEYYRNILDVGKNENCKLEIKTANFCNKVFNSNWYHPNPAVSFSYKLSLISLILGVLLGVTSIILGIISLKQ